MRFLTFMDSDGNYYCSNHPRQSTDIAIPDRPENMKDGIFDKEKIKWTFPNELLQSKKDKLKKIVIDKYTKEKEEQGIPFKDNFISYDSGFESYIISMSTLFQINKLSYPQELKTVNGNKCQINSNDDFIKLLEAFNKFKQYESEELIIELNKIDAVSSIEDYTKLSRELN